MKVRPVDFRALMPALRFPILFLLCAVSAGHAATLVVDTTSDAALSACTAAADDCSLRGAITASNASPDADAIHFQIPMADPGFQPATQHWRISVGTVALPAISEGVLIDGYTQPGAVPNTQTPLQGGLNGTLKIEILPGTGFGTQQNGLDTLSNNFNAAASTIRGLAINRFFAQVQLGGGAAHKVEGCYLGTDITGTQAAVSTPNGRGAGVRLQGPGPYQIGGTAPAQRNLLSGLAAAVVQQSTPDGLRVRGNLIGTDVTGTLAIGNTNEALQFNQGLLRNAQIGGSDPLERNVIAASGFAAILLFGSGSTPFAGTRIEGNYLGTDVSGTRALGNGLNPGSPSQPQPTIAISGIVGCNLEIGGADAGQSNLIAHGGAEGVRNDSCRGVVAADNQYRANRTLPFDNVQGGGLGGATPNDPADPDEGGGNRLQNFPELTIDAQLPNGDVQLSYRVDTALANATYPLEVRFFRAGGGGGPVARVGQASYGTPGSMATITLSAPALPVTAVAIDAAGNQSEFAPALGDALLRDGFE